MKRRKRGIFGPLLFGFFAGVIATLVVLAPGGRSWRELLSSRDASGWVDFSRAGDKVEALGDKAVIYVFKAGDYVRKAPLKK